MQDPRQSESTEHTAPYFAQRTDFGAEADPLTEAAAKRRRAGLPIVDLTESNPTRCGLALPPEIILSALASPANLRYDADPFGPLAAREAIARDYYGAHGVSVDSEALLLTASTSEAYSYLFRLLCEPGDRVLVPQPSYPLFDLLARMSDVETQSYALRYHDGWEIDLVALEASITPRTRAIVLVHPNNPTGHFASSAERVALDALAARHGLALIVDEVFLDYPIETPPGASLSFADGPEPQSLCFVLSGLSKVLALPQMKLAWTVVRGPAYARAAALHRLEFIADTYLSVATPACNAVSTWLGSAESLHGELVHRIRTNLAVLDDAIRLQPLLSRLPVHAGWSVLLRIPALEPDGDFALQLLDEAGVLVYPGSFFGLAGRGWMVISLLNLPEDFEKGCRALCRAVERQVTLEPTS